MWKTALKNFKFFKGCLPQILLGPFLNTLTHMHSHDLSEICNVVLLISPKHFGKKKIETNFHKVHWLKQSSVKFQDIMAFLDGVNLRWMSRNLGKRSCGIHFHTAGPAHCPFFLLLLPLKKIPFTTWNNFKNSLRD